MQKILFLLLFVQTAIAQDYLLQSGVAQHTVCSGTFYDSGGATGNYSAGQFGQITFFPSTAGSYIELNFSSFALEGGTSDYMVIYDGPDTTSPPINIYGTLSPLLCSGIITSSDPTGALTITFNADFANEFSGWAASISCNPNAGGIVNTTGPPNAFCSGAEAFCADGGTLEFPNISSSDCVSNAPRIIGVNSCLFTTPNPVWYYLEVANSGNIQLSIEQTTGQNGTGDGLDVDYAIWGPFPNTSAMCTEFANGDCAADHDCTGKVIDCSYSPDAVETATIPNAVAGEMYLVLITNYIGDSGYIRMLQTNIGAAGAGGTNCSIVCPTMRGTQPTACGAADGFITILNLTPATSYNISYKDDGVPKTISVTSDASGKAIIPALDAGNYTDILTDFVGCITPAAVVLNAVSAPILNSVTGASAVCSGSNAVFTLSGTPNAIVTYRIGTGILQTATIGTAGTTTVTIPSITLATTLTTTKIEDGTCITNRILSHTIAVNGLSSVTLRPTSSPANPVVCGLVTIGTISFTISNANTVTVSGLPSGVNFSYSSGMLTISGTPSVSGSFNYEVSAVGNCSTATFRGTILINNQATLVLNSATANPELCLNNAMFPLEYTIANGGTGALVSTLPSGLSSNFNAGVLSITGTPTATGSFGYTITTVGGCAAVRLSGTITVSRAATATIRYGMSPFCTSDNNIRSVTINGTGPYSGGRFASTTGLNLNATTGAINPSLSTPGNYTVTYTGPALGNCPVSAVATVVITALPTVDISYESTYCNSITNIRPVTRTGTGNFANGIYRVLPTTGLSLNANTGDIRPNLSTPGTYTITYSTLANAGCSAVTDTAVIEILETPEVIPFVVAPICSNDTFAVNLTSLTPGTTFEWTVSQTNAIGALSGSGNAISQVLSALNNTQGIVVYTIVPTANGCKGQPYVVTVIVNPLPMPQPENGSVCIKNSTGAVIRRYEIQTGLDDSDFTFEWYWNSILVPLQTNGQLSVDKAGTYSVIAHSRLSGCSSDPVVVTVAETTIGESITIHGNFAFSDNTEIVIQVDGSDVYEYQLDEGSFQASNVFSNVSNGDHTVRVQDFYGCTDASLVFTVIGYPKYFTPNNDGYHDFWNVTGFKDQTAIITIFNKYGKLLKQLSSSDKGWNGTFNGQLLPADDYWFTIKYTEKSIQKEFKSHFSLKR